MDAVVDTMLVNFFFDTTKEENTVVNAKGNKEDKYNFCTEQLTKMALQES